MGGVVMLTRRDVATTAGIAIAIAVLAIIGAVWVIWQAVGLLMPVLIYMDK
jgi:hypothetical protein